MALSKEQFFRDGYFLAKNFIDPARVRQIKIEAQQIFKNQMVEVGYTSADSVLDEEEYNKLLFRLFENYPERIITGGKHVQHLVSLHRLSLCDEIIEGVKELGVEFPNVCTRPIMFFNARRLAKKQVYWKTDPHQDWRSMQGSLNAMVVWLPLMDIDISLGALEVVPQSHKLGLHTNDFSDGFGLIPQEVADKHVWKPVEVETGDALFFSAFLFHRSGNNSTENGIRWSCHFRYNDMNEKTFIERGYPHPYVYYPNPDLITPDYPNIAQLDSYFS